MKLLKEFGRNAYVDWGAILFLSFVLFSILAWGSFSLYNAAVTGSINGADVSQGQTFKKLNQKSIEKVITLYKEKGEQREKAKAGYVGVPDPSI